MSNRALILAFAMFSAGCAEGPFEPEGTPIEVEMQAGWGSSAWSKDLTLWNGVSVWNNRYDNVRMVIGLGKTWANRAAYQGRNYYKLTEQRVLFDELSRALGAPLRLELQDNVSWFNRVRNGKDVGLWIQVWATPSRQNPNRFMVVAVRQRPKGSHAVPW